MFGGDLSSGDRCGLGKDSGGRRNENCQSEDEKNGGIAVLSSLTISRMLRLTVKFLNGWLKFGRENIGYLRG